MSRLKDESVDDTVGTNATTGAADAIEQDLINLPSGDPVVADTSNLDAMLAGDKADVESNAPALPEETRLEVGQVFFKAPDDVAGAGVFIGGGYCPFVDLPNPADRSTTLRGVVLAASGNWTALAMLGYSQVPMPTVQVQTDATT